MGLADEWRSPVQRIKKFWPPVRNVSILLMFFAGGAVAFSPTDRSSEVTRFISTSPIDLPPESLQTIVLGPLEFQFDSKKRSSLILMLLAIALYSPNLVTWVAGKLRSKPSQDEQNALSQTTEVSSNASFSVNQQFNLPLIDRGQGVEIDYFNEGVRIGNKYGFGVAAHQMVATIRAEARSLAAGFSEEEHATKYRKSKLNRLTEFCADLEADLEMPWFLQACEVYKGSFSEKHVALNYSLGILARLRKEHALLSKSYDCEAKAEREQQGRAEDYEERFKAIHDSLIDELNRLCDVLLTLNTRCTAEFTQAAATQALCDLKETISARRSQ